MGTDEELVGRRRGKWRFSLMLQRVLEGIGEVYDCCYASSLARFSVCGGVDHCNPLLPISLVPPARSLASKSQQKHYKDG